MLIIGGLGDQLSLLIWPQVTDGLFSLLPHLAGSGFYQNVFFHLAHPLSTNQPILWLFLSTLTFFFGTSFFNLFLLATMLANVALSHLLFKRYKFGLTYALIFSFSSYIWIQTGVHEELMQIWLVPLFIHLVLRYKEIGWSTKAYAALSAALLLAILISNYIGFFLLILFGLFALFDLKNLKSYVVVLFITLASSLLFLWPFVKLNYLDSSVPKGTSGYTARPLEDFVYFSSRPWYFFIPPVKNPWLGDFSKSVVSRIADTNYFLADDYFPAEHQGNYFGILFFLSVLASLIYTMRSRDKKLKREVFELVGIALIIYILMFPPFFTLLGKTIWTPSYLLYKTFPIFRVTSRLSVVLLPVLLLILAKVVDYIYEHTEAKRKLLKGFVIVLLFATLAETFIPVKVEYKTNLPAVYTYIGENLPLEAKFAVYPFEKMEDALFWLPVHQRHLMNPRTYYLGDMPTDEFTEMLPTAAGLGLAKEYGVEFIVVFKDAEPAEVRFFEGSWLIEVVYEDDEAALFRVL